MAIEQNAPAIESLLQILVSSGYVAIPFRRNIAGQLLVNARINDVEGVYILDTGASQTVIDAKQKATLHLTLNYDETALTGGGVGAHSMENVPSYNNKIEMDNFKLDNMVLAVMSLETAWESLTRAGAYDVLFGIIGVDILKTGKAIIDFHAMTLYLVQPVST
jgi:predicted aspartyl protease